jgi:hypothetical protein
MGYFGGKIAMNQIKPGIRRYLSRIGRKGGLVKSESKAQAVRLNGMKGGRPKKPWEFIGTDINTYKHLPLSTKRKILIKMGYMKGFWVVHLPTFRWWLISLKLWWNEPVGGYLLSAYIKENAERETIKWKYGNLVSYLDRY